MRELVASASARAAAARGKDVLQLQKIENMASKIDFPPDLTAMMESHTNFAKELKSFEHSE